MASALSTASSSGGLGGNDHQVGPADGVRHHFRGRPFEIDDHERDARGLGVDHVDDGFFRHAVDHLQPGRRVPDGRPFGEGPVGVGVDQADGRPAVFETRWRATGLRWISRRRPSGWQRRWSAWGVPFVRRCTLAGCYHDNKPLSPNNTIANCYHDSKSLYDNKSLRDNNSLSHNILLS